MKIYLASRYSRRDQMRRLAVELKQMGYTVTSRWLETEWVDRPDQGTAAPPEYRATYAVIDLEDVAAADVMVNFTEPPAGKCDDCDGIGTVWWPSEDGGSPALVCPGCDGKGRTNSGRGGRHVEFGYAMALGKRLIVVGHRENLFHEHPTVEFYAGQAEVLQAFKNKGGAA
jgi:hypothetical protein